MNTQITRLAAGLVKLTSLKIDPELFKLVPRPSPEDREALRESLAAGQKIPVDILPDNRILDGYTRYELLGELGVEEVQVVVVDGLKTRDDIFEYVIIAASKRRHLLDWQKFKLGEALREIEERRANERLVAGQKKGGEATAGKPKGKGLTDERSRPTLGESARDHATEASRKTSTAVGKKVGLKKAQYEKLKTVYDSKDAEKITRLESGRASVNEVYNKLIHERRTDANARKAAAIKPEDLGGDVICGDGFKLGPEVGTVDLVIVDPPYGIAATDKFSMAGQEPSSTEETIPEWDQVDGRKLLVRCGKRIAELLRKGGSFYLWCDRAAVTIAWDAAKAAGLDPKNTVVWHKTNTVPTARRNWSSAYEVCVYGVKPGAEFTWTLSGNAPNLLAAPIVGGKERRHRTQKHADVIEQLINASSNPKDLVCDFMAGSGVVGVIAKRLKRRFHLVELEQENVDTIRVRLGE